jgi:hypothetical protein
MSKTLRERAVGLTMRALFETDERKSAELIDASGDAFLAYVDELSMQRSAAVNTLLAQAERALDIGERSRSPRVRRRQLRLFNLLMDAARAEL